MYCRVKIVTAGMKILFFASLAEITGVNELVVTNISSVADLRQTLSKKFPAISAINFSIAVNRVIVNENRELVETDEVAFMPPFSGG